METTTYHDIGRPPKNFLSLITMFECVGGMSSVCAARLSQKLPGYALGGMRPVREATGLPEHEIKEFGYACAGYAPLEIWAPACFFTKC